VTLFADDMKNTTSRNWTIDVIGPGGVKHWYYPPPAGGLWPHSRPMSLWGRDDHTAGDSVIAMTRRVTIPPANVRMQFSHAYVFESDGVHHFDGGVVEYSNDAGMSWLDAGHLITAGAAYGGTLDSHFANPLGGRSAFVNDSFGRTASQLDLSSLAGQAIQFRFRIGTDETFGNSGWFIDDVRIYQCSKRARGRSTPRDVDSRG